MGAKFLSKLSVCLVGAGFISQTVHLPTIAKNGLSEVKAIYDTDIELAKKVARRFQIGTVSTSLEKLYTEKSDAIIICTPRKAMPENIFQAVKRSNNILAEKPAFYNLNDFDRITRSLGKEQLLQVGYMKKFDPGFVFLQKLIKSKNLESKYGKIKSVAIHSHNPSYFCKPPPHIRPKTRLNRFSEAEAYPDWLQTDMKIGYDFSVNVMSHYIDLAYSLFGNPLNPKRLQSKKENTSLECELETNAFSVKIYCSKKNMGVWSECILVSMESAQIELYLSSPFRFSKDTVVYLKHFNRDKKKIWFNESKTNMFEMQWDNFLGKISKKNITNHSELISELRMPINTIEELWKTI